MRFFGILDGIEKFSFKSSNVFRAFSSFPSFPFLLTRYWMFLILFIEHLQILISVFVLFALNLMYSVAVSVWHWVSTRYCSIAVFGDFFFAILRYFANFSAVLRCSETPNVLLFKFLTTIVSWCFPSKGKNSRMHTSKLLEFTFSSQTYMASSGFVSRVYLADTNTEGLPGKLCNVYISL